MEIELLCASLGVQATQLVRAQSCLKLFHLPANIVKLQVDAVRVSRSARHAVLCRRLYVCGTCAAVCDPSRHVRIRTSDGKLCCCKCKGDKVFHADMLGRIGLSNDGAEAHYWCMFCRCVHTFNGSEPPPSWTTCLHASSDKREGAKAQCSERVECGVCSVSASRAAWQRVNHLTGELHTYHFCSRHAPRGEQLRFKVNSRHMERWAARVQ